MYCDYGFLEAQKKEGKTMDALLDPVCISMDETIPPSEMCAEPFSCL